ncbi:sec-independent protein translocase protein TatB [Caulobacter ginsengisoli]|uniref:Sec-independent protein translocase protein TatB n=1 Tax=Caulobacter ginsengisoli TaxID=400775 RepID=A0ABU0IP85_9CAUL|nr:Sec-independent protein translocase protein TatB [Caulobacter ginsengisoli]MDQ0463809.1 sec-independent protein translocase protein TatB [Caulobacter ginsengisoli]
MLGPDLSFSHILIVAAVALIVVGPKDLPVLLRKVGQFVARMRGMAAEFRSSFDEMARQSELDELRKEVAAMRSGQYGASSVMGSDATEMFNDIDATLRGGDVSFSPAMAQYEPPADEPEAKPKRARKSKAEPETQTIPKPAARKTKTAAVVEPAAKPARKRAPRKPPEIVS